MWSIILCVFVSVTCAQQEGDTVTVLTGAGYVLGRITGYGRRFSFLGVPYGAVGENDPFGAAKPYPYFNTPYPAFTDGTICPQINDGKAEGSVHCLNLNIYTSSNATPISCHPVMVYVHGGNFAQGKGGLHRPQTASYLIQRDVIIVTINYRLGLFGFLCLPQLGYSNQGIQDIVLALKWIKDNIKGFGGNEENIVLFGHGSGSALVEYLLLYNEDNIFNKVILQSGQIVSPNIPGHAANDDYIATIARRLGIDTNKVKMVDVMKRLVSLDPHLLVNITKSDSFSPCIDSKFLEISPRNENFSDKKIIIGTAEKEMLIFYKDVKENCLNKFVEELDKGFSNLPEGAVEKVKNFYLKGDLKNDAIDFATDFNFNYPIERSVRYYLAKNATVYRYVFSQGGGIYWIKWKVPASHGDVLGYVFGLNGLRLLTNLDDLRVLRNMTSMLANFAQYSNPTYGNAENLWPKLTKDSRCYMNISSASNFTILEGPYRDRMAFWDTFYQEYGKYAKGFNFREDYTINVDSATGQTDI